MRTSHVSSLGLETAFKKSGQEIGDFLTSFDEGCEECFYEFLRTLGFALNWSDLIIFILIVYLAK